MRLKVVVSEAWRSLGANVSTTLAATMTVLIGMFLLGLFIALGTWVVSWSNHVKKELVVHVYFCTEITCKYEATPKQINLVASKLEADSRVKDVKFVSKEEGLRQMRKRTPDLVKGLSSNPLPNAEEVVPVKAEYVDAIAASLRPLPPGVESVNFGKKRAHRILQVAKVIESVFLVAVLILLAASTLLIANTIRLSIFSRRREIEVMKLVGATNWFVRGPFMLEGLLCGLVGAVSAVVLLVLGKEIAVPSILGHLDAGADVHALSFPVTALIILGAGLGLGAAGSGLTIRRFLRV
jgi:cell division transport system permease protein